MTSPFDPSNVQGDILAGLPKKTQTFFFFKIDEDSVEDFRTGLTKLVPLITTTPQVDDDLKRIDQHKKSAAEKKGNQELLEGGEEQECPTPELLKMSGVNIAFTHTGLVKLGITDVIGDDAFTNGMKKDAKNLGDQGSATSPTTFDPDWIPEFKQSIDGVILITGDCYPTVDEKLAEIKDIFSVGEEDATIQEVLSLIGDVRPKCEAGHEHFGFLDGVSQPAVQGVDKNPHPGQQTVRLGRILLGREGDLDNPIAPKTPQPVSRPSWALDGSFLCFRYLPQLVPEFNAFISQAAGPAVPPGMDPELLGARLVGRWKSGAPIDLSPFADDPDLGKDTSRNNNFRYDTNSQDRCPFAAHTRKTNPRSDLNLPDGTDGVEGHRIIRRGIPFGPEVSKHEADNHKTNQDRGLLFVCYQSNIINGFQFIQHSWANFPNFIFGKFFNGKPVTPGFDPIIGQSSDPNLERSMVGTNSEDPIESLPLPTEWVLARGGEYFFSPSISTLQDTFAAAA